MCRKATYQILFEHQYIYFVVTTFRSIDVENLVHFPTRLFLILVIAFDIIVLFHVKLFFYDKTTYFWSKKVIKGNGLVKSITTSVTASID